ncbi:hypothetical protein R6Q57_014966 [Mikania cordata]
MNATIVDETTIANVEFINDIMTELLDITCNDMVNLHGHDDPKIPPPQMLSKGERVGLVTADFSDSYGGGGGGGGYESMIASGIKGD